MRHNGSGRYFCILSSVKGSANRSLCCATLPRVRQTAKSCASNGPLAQPAPRRRSKIYAVELESVTKLELVIDPDRGRGHSLATLNALRLA